MEMVARPRILDKNGNPITSKKSAVSTKPRNSGYSHLNANPLTAAKRAWKWQGGGPDDDLTENAPRLRQMSRQLEYDSSVVDGMFSTRTTLAIGTGLSPDPIPDIEYLGWTSEDGQKWKNDWLRYFNTWAESTLCDSRRRDNFYELQRIAARSQDVNGDVFCTMPMIERWNSLFETCINLIEADCVDDPENSNPVFQDQLREGDDIFGGVVESPYGHVLGYWVCTDHPLARRHKNRLPSDVQKPRWVYVPVYSETGRPLILHMMESRRVGQRRGIPLIASSIEILLLIDKFIHAYATKAEIQALFTAVILSDKPDSTMMELDALMGDDADVQSAKDNDDSLLALGSGIVQAANPGDKIEAVESTAPTSNFGEYIGSGLEMVGPSVGVSKGFLTHTFPNSYSAARAESGLTWGSVLVKRGCFVNDFCKPNYNALMDEAVAKGYIDAPGYFDNPIARGAYQRCNWRGPGMPQIDPKASISAYKEGMALGVITGSQAASEYSGSDFYENISERGREISAATAAGLSNPVPSGQGTEASKIAGGQDSENTNATE